VPTLRLRVKVRVQGVVGWFFVSKGNFGAFNASGGSLYGAIGIAAGVALFSFIGVEVAAITAKRVDNPRKNVGRASVLGTLASALLYLVVYPRGTARFLVSGGAGTRQISPRR
jgi:amino acid transporter